MVALKGTSWSLTPQYLRRWPPLEIEILKRKMRSSEWPWASLTGVLIRRGRSDTQRDTRVCTQRKTTWGHSVKAAICRWRTETSEECKPCRLIDMSVADFQGPEPWENQHLLFKQPVLGIVLWQPEKTNIPLHPPPLLEPKRDFLLRGKKQKQKPFYTMMIPTLSLLSRPSLRCQEEPLVSLLPVTVHRMSWAFLGTVYMSQDPARGEPQQALSDLGTVLPGFKINGNGKEFHEYF